MCSDGGGSGRRENEASCSELPNEQEQQQRPSSRFCLAMPSFVQQQQRWRRQRQRHIEEEFIHGLLGKGALVKKAEKVGVFERCRDTPYHRQVGETLAHLP